MGGAWASVGGLHLQLVARGFVSPVSVAAPRGEPGRLYVVEQRGTIRVLDHGKLRPQPFLDIQSIVGSESNEQGLLSVAFHPKYARNHRLYVDYTDRNGDTRVVEYRSDGQSVLPRTARRLLFVDQPYSNHNGGQLQLGPDGMLYAGMGDGGSGGDPDDNGQNAQTSLAKLLRTDPLRVDWQIAGYGLRNPWRFSFDRATGDLYIADVGQSGWEEIDYRPRGAAPANFGWARFEGTHFFKDVPLLDSAPLVQPIVEYSHEEGCSVTGGYVYRGSAVPSARGRYFYGDYCTGTIWSLGVVDGRAIDVRHEPLSVPELTTFGEGARGELYLVSRNGTIYRLAS